MSPPSERADAQPVSRRTFIALTGVAVAATAVTADLFASPDPAAAAVSWGHPFAYRQAAGSRFGMRRGKMHAGQDYPAATNTPIYAVADGVVAANGTLGTNGAYGNAVFLNHADGWSTRYAHMVKRSTLKVGQTVTRGALIGAVGNTGSSTGPHLHLELRKNGKAVDPYPYVQSAPLANSKAPAAAPIPTPPLPPLEDDMTYSIAVNGHYFAVGPEFISHHSTAAQATVTRNVLSATDKSHILSPTEFQDLLDGLGIPRDKVQGGAVFDPQTGAHRGNGTWSRELEILAALAKLTPTT